MPSRKQSTVYKIRKRKLRVCSKCGVEKERDCFNKDSSNLDGLYPSCKECRKKRTRKYYLENKEQIIAKSKSYRKTKNGKRAREVEKYRRAALHPEKYKANYTLTNAVRDGRLHKPSVCESCGENKKGLHGHHHDYSKPLEVTWLCTSCHQEEHNRLREL